LADFNQSMTYADLPPGRNAVTQAPRALINATPNMASGVYRIRLTKPQNI
jgi:hypothetical protein